MLSHYISAKEWRGICADRGAREHKRLTPKRSLLFSPSPHQIDTSWQPRERASAGWTRCENLPHFAPADARVFVQTQSYTRSLAQRAAHQHTQTPLTHPLATTRPRSRFPGIASIPCLSFISRIFCGHQLRFPLFALLGPTPLPADAINCVYPFSTKMRPNTIF